MRIQAHHTQLMAGVLLLIVALGTESLGQRRPRSGHRDEPVALVFQKGEEHRLRRALDRRRYQELMSARQRYEAAEAGRERARDARRQARREHEQLEQQHQRSRKRLESATRNVEEINRRLAESRARGEQLRVRRLFLEREIALLDRTVHYLLAVAGPQRVPVPAHRRAHSEWRTASTLLDGLLDQLRDPERCSCMVDDAERRLHAHQRELRSVIDEERELEQLRYRVGPARAELRAAQRSEDQIHRQLDDLAARLEAFERQREPLRRVRNQRCEEWNRALTRARAALPGTGRPPVQPPRYRERALKVRKNFDTFLAVVAKSRPEVAAQLRKGPLFGVDERDGTLKVTRGQFKDWVSKKFKKEHRFGPIRKHQGPAKRALKRMKRSHDQDISEVERNQGGDYLFLMKVGDSTMLVLRYRPGEPRVFQDIFKP